MSTINQHDASEADGADNEWAVGKLDVDAYLARVESKGDLRADVETLFALHRAHADSIPFENLNVVLKHVISLDLDDVQTKLVHQKRGGYCFEHNLLFSAMLERLGFKLRRLAGRVEAARTHMLLIVEAGGREWLADVGFGATLLEPIPFEEWHRITSGWMDLWPCEVWRWVVAAALSRRRGLDEPLFLYRGAAAFH